MEKSETNIVENEGGKGNPYHEPAGSPQGGQFTSAPKEGEAEKESGKSKAFNLILLGKKSKEAQDFFVKMPSQFDSAKTSKLSAQEKVDLLAAFNYYQGKQEAINKAVEDYNKEPIEGAWLEPKYPSDYHFLKGSGKFDAKLDYFKNKYNKPDKDEMIAKMEEYQKAGEMYEDVYASTASQFLDAEILLNEYKPTEVDYTAAKANAVRIDYNDFNVEREECIKLFGPQAKKHIEEKKKTNPKGVGFVEHYTGSYHIYNEPLRNTEYVSASIAYKTGWRDRIEKMDDVLDSFSIDKDVFLRRGVSQLDVLNIGSKAKTISGYSNNSTDFLNSLIGTTFKDNGYVSCGTSEHTGFTDYNIEMKIFVPKGAHAFYVEGLSHFSGGHENETIIARGYNYKITNAYNKGGKVIVECDLILNSNEDRPSGNQLDAIASKYIS